MTAPAATAIPYVAVEGPPYERGMQYGFHVGDRIHKNLALYRDAFAAQGLEWPRALELAARFAAFIERYDASLLEEMRGIAAAAELRSEEVVAMNARTELLYWQDDGCTTAACLPPVTTTGHTLLGQNWDWRTECGDSVVVLHVKPPDGLEILTFVEAGMLARCGLNSAGVGVVGNFLESDADFGHEGIPVTLLRRRMLACATLEDAVDAIRMTPRAFSSNHLIAAADAAVDCETTPTDVFVLDDGDDGILEHSNHFRSHTALARVRDMGVRRYPDSVYRDRCLRRALVNQAPKIGVVGFQHALRNHHGAPTAVCRHAVGDSHTPDITTVASIVMDLDARDMWVTSGPPCKNEYRKYSLSVDI